MESRDGRLLRTRRCCYTKTMQSLPPLPEWVKLEHQVAKKLTQQEIHGWYFDEQSARKLESALRTEYERLLRYFSTGILTLQERNLLLKEIIRAKGTSKVVRLLD